MDDPLPTTPEAGPRPPWPEERELWLRYARGGRADKALRNRLIEGHVPLAVASVRRFLRRLPGMAHLRDDLVGAALERLVAAAELFDPTLGWRFATYAGNACYHGCWPAAERLDDEARQRRNALAAAKRRPDAGGEPIAVVAVGALGDDKAGLLPDLRDSPELAVDAEDAAGEIRARLRRAAGADGELLIRYAEGHETLAQIGAELGVSKERVRQRIARARQRYVSEHGGR